MVNVIVMMVNKGFGHLDYMTHPITVWVDDDNKFHRDDGPAVECSDGGKEWYQHGERHRDDGPAVEWASGTKVWYQHGKKHRDDGPAFEWADGTKEYYQHGEIHRVGGPAIEGSDGGKEWWLNGNRYDTEEKWKTEKEKIQ
jgi:hypothetical protein